MRKKLVAGNWKSNGLLADARSLAQALADASWSQAVDVAVFPPYVHLAATQAILESSPVILGAQDISPFGVGAFTGEINGAMLADLGCHYVLVGHSERRSLCGDDDDALSRKIERTLSSGLAPILCVGETLEEREGGRARDVVLGQLESVWKRMDHAAGPQLTIAYEPVWAIGTGHSASPGEAEEVHRWIRAWLVGQMAAAGEATRILYGGSVNGGNAAELFRCQNIDGALVGGASLKIEDFLEIYRRAANSRNK